MAVTMASNGHVPQPASGTCYCDFDPASPPQASDIVDNCNYSYEPWCDRTSAHCYQDEDGYMHCPCHCLTQ